jgi:uncharacterized protein (TIGR02145 family)
MNRLRNILGIILSLIFIQSCEDKPERPSLTTTMATEISTTTAVSGGNITNDGGAQIVTGGVCWNTSDDPTTENNRTIEGGQLSSFTSNITQLSPNTTYYVRAYATNSAGTAYGKSVSFKTLGDKPSSSILNASNITINSATFNGSVNANLLSTTVTFEYGVTTSYGSTATIPQNPVTGNSNVNVTSDLTGLTPGTTYHFRIKTENSLGITYSSDMTFTTLGKVPDVTVLAATNLQIKTATISGSVNPNYLLTIVTFEWGTSTSFENTITLTQSTVTGNSSENVSVDLTGLTSGTIYYFRIKATNELGTTYGDHRSFITNVTDYDGNVYHPIYIGTQIWLVENLKVTHYRDGTTINNIDSNTPWNSISTGAFCYYEDDIDNSTDYGNLYNWYATADARGLCPTGWHVPTDLEWEILNTYLGGELVAGGKMKEAGSTHWIGLNAGANNSSGFSALPGGRRFDDGIPAYGNKGYDGFWWSSSEFDSSSAWNISIYTSSAILIRSNMYKKTWGFSIRCLKDSK